MEDDLQEAQEDFLVLVSELNDTTPGTMFHVEAPGDFFFSARENLFWFRHVVFYRDCDRDCAGHEYWGAHVGHLRQFDVGTDVPYNLQGYRVVGDLREAIDGTWADGGRV